MQVKNKKKLNWKKVESGTNQNGKLRQKKTLNWPRRLFDDAEKLPQNWPINQTTIYQYLCLRLFFFYCCSFCVCGFSSLRLKEEIKTIECKMSSLAVDLRRREDDSSDLREKLGDSKKQIQQVQKEVRTHSSLIHLYSPG